MSEVHDEDLESAVESGEDSERGDPEQVDEQVDEDVADERVLDDPVSDTDEEAGHLDEDGPVGPDASEPDVPEPDVSDPDALGSGAPDVDVAEPGSAGQGPSDTVDRGSSAPETGDLVIDAALRDLAEAPDGDLDAQIERGEQVQRTLQGRLGDLGG